MPDKIMYTTIDIPPPTAGDDMSYLSYVDTQLAKTYHCSITRDKSTAMECRGLDGILPWTEEPTEPDSDTDEVGRKEVYLEFRGLQKTDELSVGCRQRVVE